MACSFSKFHAIFTLKGNFFDDFYSKLGRVIKLKYCCVKRKGPLLVKEAKGLFGRSRGGRIRTYGLVVPNDARYRAALHPEN
jgi:hypothetical protein